MSRTFVVLVTLLSFHLSVFAQSTTTDTLRIEQKFFSTDYYVGSQEVNHDAFVRVLTSSPDSSVVADYTSGKNTLVLANAFGFAGGFCVGYGLSSNPTNTALAVAGAVAVVAGIVIETGANAKIERAIQKYNLIESKRQATSSLPMHDPGSVRFTLTFPL